MSYQTRNLTRLCKQRLVILLSLAALTGTLLVYGAAPAHAQEPAPQAPPGDCWNSALSGDPLHCYILEEAQRAGEIEVAAVYEAPSGPLYIFLRQDEPISDQVSSFFKEKAYEYLETPAGRGRYSAVECFGYTGDQRKYCFDGVMGRPMWSYYDAWIETGLPRSKVYENILLYTGGAEARSSEPGWASWRQVWPAVAGVPDGAEGFDVSDVDVTNFPEPDCDEEFPGISSPNNRSCHAWQYDPDVGIAGRHRHGDKFYVQLKVSDPEDETEIEASEAKLHPSYIRPGQELVIIPVKYDFGELWRWSVILNRFAVSAGNTVGITRAEVGVNVPMYQSPLVWPLEDLNQATSINHAADIRETIVVWALDPHVAAAALPQLLPKLDIPFDAVGVVAHAQRFLEPDVPASAGAQSGSVVATANSDSQDSAGAVAADSSGPSPASAVRSDVESDSDAAAKAPTDSNQAGDIAAEEPPTGRLGSGVDTGVSMWVVAGTGGVVVFAILGAVIFLTVRWHRRRALRVL